MAPSVHRATTWAFDSGEHAADVFAGRTEGWLYSRSSDSGTLAGSAA
jgi:O-acetylhomoserine/O-acetylserine sulfhydrylase-like pyridoxal-dependent enzyme